MSKNSPQRYILQLRYLIGRNLVNGDYADLSNRLHAVKFKHLQRSGLILPETLRHLHRTKNLKLPLSAFAGLLMALVAITPGPIPTSVELERIAKKRRT